MVHRDSLFFAGLVELTFKQPGPVAIWGTQLFAHRSNFYYNYWSVEVPIS